MPSLIFTTISEALGGLSLLLLGLTSSSSKIQNTELIKEVNLSLEVPGGLFTTPN